MKPMKLNRRRLIGLVSGLVAIFGGSQILRLFMTEKKNKNLHKILHPQEKHWVGDGFYVSTMFSVHAEDYRFLTPFLLLDHAAPKQFPSTERKLGVGEHPHRGFETVTFAIQGEVDHRDSGGGGGRIETGGVQWMTAGSGVVHEEFHSRNFAKNGGTFEMVQLWVNLKAKDKMTKPRYQSMDNEDFPIVDLGDNKARVKVIAGVFQDAQGPAQTFSDINIFEIFADSEQSVPLQLLDQTNTLIVQLKGSSRIEDRSLNTGEVALFDRDGEGIDLQVSANSHLLVLNGEPIDEPVAHYGPFVMNTQQEIMQAIRDFQAGKMGQLVEEATPNGGT